MVDGAGEFEQLPFLEIDPAEKLFEFMADQSLHGHSYQSSLFDRPIRIEFGIDPDLANNMGHEFECAPVWSKISSPDSRCPTVKVGIDANQNWTGQDIYYFSAGITCFISDDEEWELLDHGRLRQVILEYIRNTMHYGFFEFWRGTMGVAGGNKPRLRGIPISGPLRDHDRSPGWLRRAIELEEQSIAEFGPETVPRWIGWFLVAGLGLLFSPIIIPAFVIFGIPYLLRNKSPHGRRYPPYPTG